jgi:hypothetical protein
MSCGLRCSIAYTCLVGLLQYTDCTARAGLCALQHADHCIHHILLYSNAWMLCAASVGIEFDLCNALQPKNAEIRTS